MKKERKKENASLGLQTVEAGIAVASVIAGFDLLENSMQYLIRIAWDY